jgi:hypothetical protein
VERSQIQNLNGCSSKSLLLQTKCKQLVLGTTTFINGVQETLAENAREKVERELGAPRPKMSVKVTALQVMLASDEDSE